MRTDGCCVDSPASPLPSLSPCAQTRINPTDPQPTCTMCPGYYIPRQRAAGVHEEGGGREAGRSAGARRRDRQGARRHRDGPPRRSSTLRRRIPSPSTIRSARCTTSSTARRRWCLGRTSPTGSAARPRCGPCVEFNGPGNNGSDIRNGVTYQLKAGDVVVIPAGTGHWFTKIDDHIDYLMVRIDPDKVTPLKSEAASKEYLSKPAPRGQ